MGPKSLHDNKTPQTYAYVRMMYVLGKFNPTIDVRYLDESVELGLQSTRVFPGQAIDLSRHEMHVHTLQHPADPDGITNRDDIAEETDEDDIYISEKADEDDISEKADEDDISEKADEDEVSDKADMEAGAEAATKINRELFVGEKACECETTTCVHRKLHKYMHTYIHT